MFAVLLPWLGLGAVLTALGGALLLAVRGFPALRGRHINWPSLCMYVCTKQRYPSFLHDAGG